MASGPTQNYDDPSLGVWKGRPVVAATARALLVVGPVALSVGLGLAAVRWFPPHRLGVDPWLWLLVEVSCATLVLIAATRLARRLTPLATLLRLTLYFPDRAPSRLAVAMRHYSPHALHADRRGVHPQDDHADRILGLVAAISEHDQLTRGHSERVQAYSALIGKELGLSEREAARLSWAALLHDVGKLRVPADVLSKSGRPTTSEWTILAGHPEAGMEIAQPLRDWLGPWLEVIGQHHERWDGGGYPAGLAGTAISEGARIVAVADAYDAITSVRSYKRALSASAARAELARCAGEQFDPQVVRAFLAIGLGRLRRVAGPLSVLSALPSLPSFASDLPSVVQRFSTVGALQGAGTIGLVLSVSTAAAGGALASGPLPADAPASVSSGTSVVGTTHPDEDGDDPAPAAVVDPVVAPTTSGAGADEPRSDPTPASPSPAPSLLAPTPSVAPEVLPSVAATSPIPDVAETDDTSGKDEGSGKEDGGSGKGSSGKGTSGKGTSGKG
ncbi:HD-GYP domain-containing protein [Cellulomonas sp. ICMP 17802]|uniref:HD-GYP domain-containing protein n=1 Tax=Cellulomonas sp. ICMP 17802 TaxID=3239199 RepID=UPI00351B8DB4